MQWGLRALVCDSAVGARSEWLWANLRALLGDGNLDALDDAALLGDGGLGDLDDDALCAMLAARAELVIAVGEVREGRRRAVAEEQRRARAAARRRADLRRSADCGFCVRRLFVQRPIVAGRWLRVRRARLRWRARLPTVLGVALGV